MVALALCALVSCAPEAKKIEPVTVEAQKVQFSSEASQITLVGSIEPNRSSTVNSQWPGTLTNLSARKGQKVSSGDIIAIVDAQGVKSAYDAAKATFDQASDALERMQEVYGTGGVTKVNMIDVQTSYAKAEASLASAAKALEDCRIKAPYSGTITQVYVEQGVEITAATPIVQIVDIGTIEIHAQIPENDYSLYKIGDKAAVEVQAAGKTLNAFLAVKGVQASRMSHSYEFIFKTEDNASRVMPGMVCKVMMKYPGVSEMAVVPASAVMTGSDGRYVWCIKDGAVVKRHIVTGGFSKDGIAVKEGLERGDTLIVKGTRKVSSGMTDIKLNWI